MFDFIVLSPGACADYASAIAASRAGSLGVADTVFISDPAEVLRRLDPLARLSRGPWGIQTDDPAVLAAVLGADLSGLETVLVASHDPRALAELVGQARAAGVRAFAVATDLAQATAAHAAGADAVVARGDECGGWIGEEGAFVLLQRLRSELALPVWVQGGIGLHTVAAAFAGGAAGAVLDGQLLLTRDSGLGERERAAVAAMDGSETIVLGRELGAAIRAYARPALRRLDELAGEERRLLAEAPEATRRAQWRDSVRSRVGDGSLAGLFPVGQDACLARSLAERFATVSGVLAGMRDAIAASVAELAAGNPLGEGSALAQSHGTRYPIAQGPMTRVSDRPQFAAEVARAGGLPFLALALLRGEEVDALLSQTRELVGELPWGVGILGFVPPALRAEQLEVVRRHRPPFALIAGGRADQAHELEELGIATYLHVPSPGLLRLYLSQGARRFVFEGRECGGHVGPRTSFVLWDSMLEALLEESGGPPPGCHVLFAGGVHDAHSAAMVAAAASAASRRGVSVGVLLGTAYLFTAEATETGAITPTFQAAAFAARETALLESGPGHATRCLVSPFVEQFEAAKRRLRDAGAAGEELRLALEELNIGRLRIAAKGTDRNPGHAVDPAAPRLIELDGESQWDSGLYMIGQVATLRSAATTLAALHADVSSASSEVLANLVAPAAAEAQAQAPPPADVAIVGVGCILPGAPDIASYWANILGKVDAVDEIPPERWDWRMLYDPDPATPDRVNSRWGGFIAPVPFDPIGSGLPPKSLHSIEPFQLLALITAQAALQDAGYARRPFARERTSVILGAGGGGADLSVGYSVRSMLPALLGDRDPQLAAELMGRLPEWTEDSFAGLLMNVAAGRIANRLDLGGTNYTVDAACASSLAAISLAVRELQAGTSDMVLAGGVDAIQNPFAFLCFAKTHALSPRGRCRPFDASADGIAISEGFATVVLKRRADAERDGDRIYAVIRGVGSASDGRDRSLTAPRPEGQMLALRRAYEHARVSPATVGLVEAHGTGTVAGDGAEVTALTRVFAEHGTPAQACAIGSVKSMIGHTKATAGVAGLVKAALALHHRVLPPTLGVTQPNPQANFPASPFYVNTEARPWLSGGADHPRRAGVSAFGFGGTDFHVVLEEYTDGYGPAALAAMQRWPAELLLWRGSREEIGAALAALAEQLAGGAEPSLAELAHTVSLAAPPPAPEQAALAIVAETLEDLRSKLDAALRLVREEGGRHHALNGIHWVAAPLGGEGRKVAFLFPGQGSQAVDMARDVALAFPEAREPFELADRILAGAYERPLSRFILPPPSFGDDELEDRRRQLTHTHVAQAALGVAELAYLGVLRALGVEADMTAGHSYGELVALAAAGALDDACLLRLSEARGRSMAEAASQEPGAMAAVDAAVDALAPLLELEPKLVVANLNGPAQTVVSGPGECIERALRWCAEHELHARSLPVSCAFHSPLVAGARQRFAQALAQATIVAPAVPVFSNTTGDAHAQDPGEIVSVLERHLAEPVRFAAEIERMHQEGARLFVEVGPRAVLSGLTDRILEDREHLAVPVDRRGRHGLVQLLHCVAALASEGVPVKVDRLFAGRGLARLSLDRLAEPPPNPPAGRWLIDGGSARPADGPPPAPAPRAEPVVAALAGEPTPPGAEPVVAAFAGEPTPAAPGASASSPPSTVPQGQEPIPVSSRTDGNGHHPPPPVDRAAEVLIRYQQLMGQFLETERAVMLGYLQGVAPSTERASIAALMPALAMPAPLAESPAATAPLAAPVAPAAAAAPTAPPPSSEVESPAPAATDGAAPVEAAEIERRLLEIVCERTGYPADMLGLDADLEADLGIDSIKRVEIAGTFTETLAEAQRAAIDMEELITCRTLRSVIDVLERSMRGALPASTGAAGAPFEPGPAEEERIGRFVVTTASAPAASTTAGLCERGVILITDDGAGLGAELAAALPSGVLVSRSALPADEQRAGELAEGLAREHGGVKAIIHLAADEDRFGGVEVLHLLVRALHEQLAAAANAGGAAVLAVRRRGGGQRACAGFLKSLALEWPSVRMKAVDLSEQESAAPRELVAPLLAELHAGDGAVEVGYRDGRRLHPQLAAAALDQLPDREALDEHATVLLTGGARGITAEVAVALAERYRPTLVLVGRTPLAPEAESTACHGDPAALRQALIEARRAGGEPLSPALVEADCRRILRGREVRESLERIARAGSRVEYLECDVSDAAAFAALLEGVYERHARIDGVIHGAGLIEDRLVVDKELESLRRVLAAKAGAASTLAQHLRPEGLRFLVLFGSVSGRFGNRGQADYAAASEALAGLAEELDARWPARVVAIDWGPWAGVGMAAALEAQFAARGVGMIGPRRGSEMLIEELARGRKGETEVVIGAPGGVPQQSAGEAREDGFALLAGIKATVSGATTTLSRQLALGTDLYLDHHRVDGRPVLPFAVAMELMAEAALLASPGRVLRGLREIRLLAGISVPEEDAIPIDIAAAQAGDEVTVRISGSPAGRLHYSATASFDAGARSAALPAELTELPPFPMDVAEAYRDLLFHGPLFQGIVEIAGLDERGSSALLRASDPAACVADSGGLSFLLDPLLLDCAFQVQVLWARMRWDVTMLPAQIGAYDLFAAPRPGELVRHEMRIRPETAPPMCHCDHWLLGVDGRPLAVLRDAVGVGARSLNRLAATAA